MTIGEICKLLTFLVGLITAVEFLFARVKKLFDKAIKPLDEKITKVEIENVKTDLVNLMCLADNGSIDPEQKIRLHELYDKYTLEFKLNSYVHLKYERLLKEGKI